MATKGIKLKDKDNNVILPVTSSDLVEVKYGGQAQILTNLLEQNEQVTAEALSDLYGRLSNTVSREHSHAYYCECATASTTAAKTATITDFELVDGSVITVKFTNTNFATSAPTLNISNSGAKTMWRMFEGSEKQIVGAFIQQGYRYTFIYDETNNRFMLIDSDFHTNDVIEIVLTGYTYTGSGLEPISGYALDDRYFSFFHIDSSQGFLKRLRKYKIIFTKAQSLTYLTLIFGSGYTYNITDYNATAYGSWASWVCDEVLYDSDTLYFNYFLNGDGYYFAFIEASNDYNKLGQVYAEGTKSITIVEPSLITDTNNRNVGRIQATSATLNYAEGLALYSPAGSALPARINNNPGIVIGVPKTTTAAANYNLSDANITIDRYDKKFMTKLSSNASSSYAFMRYETPLIYRINNYQRPASATKGKRFYCLSYEGYILTTYNTGASATAYANCIVGNNYCDITTHGAETGCEMYFYNGVTLRNYLTVRTPYLNENIKYFNSNITLAWDDEQREQYGPSINIHRERLTFDGSDENYSYTNIIYNGIQTGMLNIKTSVGETISTIAPTGAEFLMNVNIQNSAYAQKYYETSDERLKHNISKITSNDDINVYTFIKQDDTTYSYGFIAQNVASTHPELINYSYNSSYMNVDYNSTLSLLLAKAMNRIDELEKRVKILENK